MRNYVFLYLWSVVVLVRESYIKLGEWQLSFNPEFYSNKLVRLNL